MTLTLLGSGENSTRLTSSAPGVIDQYNTTQQGTITGAQWYQDWQFKTDAPDTISITVQRSPDYTTATPNVLRPSVILLDSSGQELTRVYVDNSGAQAEIDHYSLPDAGQFTVRVTRDGDKTGQTTGGYALTLTLDGSGDGSPLLTTPTGTVAVGTPANGTIDAAHWMNIWTFSGQQGQVVTITATRTDGTLVPYLELRDSNGQSETTAYPDDTADVVHIDQYTLPYTGDYQIVVSRENGQTGYSTGGYSLTIQ
jgi:hypothetical protein